MWRSVRRISGNFRNSRNPPPMSRAFHAPSSLILNGRGYAYRQLTHAFDSVLRSTLTPYERHTLNFCRQWLTGREHFVTQTSGSTGAPKAISIRRSQMVASAGLTGRALGLRSADRALVCLSTEHIAGIMMLVRCFELNLAATVIEPTKNPLADLPEESVFDFTALVPMQLQEILASTPVSGAGLDRMRAILVGGGPVSESLLEQIRSLRVPVYHTYGMTETVSHIALRRLNGCQASDYFFPLEGVELGLDERGGLTVKSVLTQDKTLATNDRVEFKPDGSFRWLGRLDNVINTGGVKVQAEKVESALAKLLQRYRKGALAGRRFFVAPLEHARLGQAVMVIMEGDPISVDIQEDIRARLLRGDGLSKYEAPRYVSFRPSLIETATGKIDRRANLQSMGHSR